MRKFLMASAATLGAVGIVGAASAQTAPSRRTGRPGSDARALRRREQHNNYQGGPALPDRLRSDPRHIRHPSEWPCVRGSRLGLLVVQLLHPGARTGAAATGVPSPG